MRGRIYGVRGREGTGKPFGLPVNVVLGALGVGWWWWRTADVIERQQDSRRRWLTR